MGLVCIFTVTQNDHQRQQRMTCFERVKNVDKVPFFPLPHLRHVDIDSGPLLVEAAVQRPVVMEKSLKIQRHFFTFVLQQKG